MRRLALTSSACAVALCWLLAGRVAAHNFPTPFKLLFTASDPARIVVLLRPGLALTEDGGSAWNFVCGAASGIAGDDTYPALLAGGHLLVGGFVGLYRDDGLGCGWSRVERSGLPGGRIASLLADDDGSVTALVAPGGGVAGLFVSRDDGSSWSAREAQLPAAMPRSLAKAPGDPRRWYLLEAAGVWVSEDAGAHWSERARLAPECEEILAVDPSDADRSYLRCGGRVLVSSDAAASFGTWTELPDVGGFAIASDGSSRWVGSRAGGLWRQDGDGELQLLHADLHVGCLQHSGGTLWVCARDELGYDAFALATSRDAGKTLTPLMRSAQVSRLRSCGNPQQAATCNGEWNQWKADVALSAPQDAGAEAGASMDAGIDASPAPEAGPPAPAQSQPSAAPASCAAHAPGVSGLPRCWLGMCLIGGVIRTVRRRAKRRMTEPRESGMRKAVDTRRTPWQPSNRFQRATTRSPRH